MILIDSNVIIDAAKPNSGSIAGFIEKYAPAVSIITKIEVLGYHNLRDDEIQILNDFFAVAHVIPIDDQIADSAIELRQARRVKLGDALIAATALVHSLSLATRDTKDFDWIPGLTLIDPLQPDTTKT